MFEKLNEVFQLIFSRFLKSWNLLVYAFYFDHKNLFKNIKSNSHITFTYITIL